MSSGGARVLDQGGQIFPVGCQTSPSMGCLFGAPLYIGRLLPPLLWRQEAPLWGASAVRGALSNTSAANKSGYQISVAVLLQNVCIILQIMHRLIYSPLGAKGRHK